MNVPEDRYEVSEHFSPSVLKLRDGRTAVTFLAVAAIDRTRIAISITDDFHHLLRINPGQRAYIADAIAGAVRDAILCESAKGGAS